MKTMHKPESFYGNFERKGGAEPAATHYCPGCGHGVIHKLMAEVIDELGIRDRVVLISPVGCSVFAYYYFDTGNVQVAHGRAPAVATGIKRSRPDSIVISYQGDGDLAAIGGNNILQAANRGENISVIFVNNAIYGMTGGQLAPTSLLGMKTTTTPEGRAFADYGAPMKVAELMSGLDGVSLAARHSLTTAGNITKTRKAIKKALKYQMEGKGFSLVEILSQCPTGWKMDPVDSLDWIEENMVPIFPPQTYKDEPHERPTPPDPGVYDPKLVDEVVRGGGRGDEVMRTHEGVPWAAAFEKGEQVESLKIKAAGFGGQGILMLGELVAKGSTREGMQSTWLPSYGPEMRGGTANCSVVVSRNEIGNPTVVESNVLIAMNRPSLEKFEAELEPGSVLIYDNSLIDVEPTRDDLRVFAIPATRIADGLGSGKVANVVMVGALMKVLGFPGQDALENIVGQLGRTEQIRAANLEALKGGADAVELATT
ncbi:MAG TPA: 2-oxoacid:acceptor oxidoreductase family protein [Candidatus Krumholzibacteria bacterium]|nr:2-oxoacid:acceptor oxidoreductase family protein [Candidatus Krumholzibacteria bacterium]